jgi:LPS export ABC transporter protein LptC
MGKQQIRRLLLGASCLMVFITFYFMFFDNNTIDIRHATNEKSYITKPFFRGIAEDMNIYEVSANKAVQVEENIYQMDNIFLKYYLDMQKSNFASISSNYGEMNEATKVFEFIDNVEIVYSIGYRATTNRLKVNFKTMTVSNDDNFSITGAKGKISSSNGITYHIRQKKMLFKGAVKTVLLNQVL